jgi:hypothetical protein
VPPIEDDPAEPLFDFSSVVDEPVDDEPPDEPPLSDDPLPPVEPLEPDVPPELLCADATPTPSAARAPARNNRSLILIVLPPRVASARRAVRSGARAPPAATSGALAGGRGLRAHSRRGRDAD